MSKFVTLLSKYLPQHFKIAPKDVELYLSEPLEQVPLIRTRYLEGTLTPTDSEIEYNVDDNLDPFKDEGVVLIENEYIKYKSIDRTTNKLQDLERGFFGTEPSAHCNEILWTAKLKEDLDAFSTTITFTSVTNIDKIPKEGKFRIFSNLSDTADEEIISYSGYNQYLNGFEFTNVTRGVYPTVACNHPIGSFIEEDASVVIEQVESLKYDKGLWTANLTSALAEDDETADIDMKFSATLSSTIVDNQTTIFLKDILSSDGLSVGIIPTRGYVLIEDEVIRYGNYVNDSDDSHVPLSTGRLEQCIRGCEESTATTHDVNNLVLWALPASGEFLIDEEYIRYETYSTDTTTGVITLGSTDDPLLRGYYGTMPADHDINVDLKERRNTELEPEGVFKIGKEYFRYWYFDDDYFYIDKRPALHSKTYYRTSTTALTSIIEPHDIGSLIITYHFDDENSYLIDFLHVVAEHLDIAVSSKIDKFESFSDADNVDINYLKYIVKQLGEELDDYQNLPFFLNALQDKLVVSSVGDIWTAQDSTGVSSVHGLVNDDSIVFLGQGGGVQENKYYLVTNATATTFQIKEISTGTTVTLVPNESNKIAYSDYRIRLFTKELVNIYKQKGLLSALKLWHTVISKPLKYYQDLWTFNYCSFYSLPFLALLLYEPLRTFYPNNENFFRPQISTAIQEELAEYYQDKYLRDPNTATSYNISDLKLVVDDWEYIAKTDDDLKSSHGKSFDDKIVPCDSLDNEGVYYDTSKVHLEVRSDPTISVSLPFYVEDYDVDLFKFEGELETTEALSTMPVHAETCVPLTIDSGFVSDYDSEWIQDDLTIGLYEYCDITDKDKPIRTDLNVLVDLTSDIGNAVIVLDNNLTTDSTDDVVVRVLDGRLYNPIDHITSGTTPAIPPKGFVKLGDEIISYTGLQFNDIHDGTFTNKRYILTGSERGVYTSDAGSYKVNLYEDYERLLVSTISLITAGTPNTYQLNMTRNPKTFGVSIGDYLQLVQANGDDEQYTITDVISEYNYCTKRYDYGVQFESNSVTTSSPTVSPITHYDCTINETTSRVEYVDHGLIDGTSIYFLNSYGTIHAYERYYVLNSTADNFELSYTSGGSAINFENIYITTNTFLEWGTRILKTNTNGVIGYPGYQHRYSMIQHLLWRLDNEINGNDLPLVYGLTSAEVITNKLDSYRGVSNGIIWPTPHFKYGFDITNTNLDEFSPNDVITLILKKLKQYKPKHTVADLTFLYPLDVEQSQLGVNVPDPDDYQTETMMSDAYVVRSGETSIGSNNILVPNHDLHNCERIYIVGATDFTEDQSYYVLNNPVDNQHIQVTTSLKNPAPFTVPDITTIINITVDESVTIYQVPYAERHIEVRHDASSVLPDDDWELPIITTDVSYDYGSYVNFNYIWHDGLVDEETITYGPFLSYPHGLVSDSWRNRKRFFNFVDL